MPVSLHRELHEHVSITAFDRPQAQHHFALGGELDGIADQVDAAPAAAAVVADEAGGAPVDVEQAASTFLAPILADRITDRSRSRRSTRKRRGSSVSLPASILEKSRMSLMMVSSESRRACDRLDVVALLGGQRGVEQQLGHAEDAVHRRADFMAHVGQELALGHTRLFGPRQRLLQLYFGILAGRNVAVSGHKAAAGNRRASNLQRNAIGRSRSKNCTSALAGTLDEPCHHFAEVAGAELTALCAEVDELTKVVPPFRTRRREGPAVAGTDCCGPPGSS